MNYKPSEYQNNIFDWIKNGSGNCIIQSVAGSGKTTTIVEATKLISEEKKVIFLAFNKDIQMELKKKLPKHIKCKTLHSLGYSMFFMNGEQPIIDNRKNIDIVNNILEEYDYGDDKYFREILYKVIEKTRSTIINYNTEIIHNYYKDFNYSASIKECEITEEILNKIKIDKTTIDFQDMIWFPIVHDFYCNKYDYVFVDEVQDLNNIQFELIKKICDDKTRVIGVGDRKQSIYGFRYVDLDSMDKFKEYYNCAEFPLSICYRCPKKHINLVRRFVPYIEADEKANEGILEQISLDDLHRIEDDACIICRTNAPLVDMVFSLIRLDKKATILGRNIGKNLLNIINKYKTDDFEKLKNKLEKNIKLQNEKLKRILSGQEDIRKKGMVLSIIDTYETILVISENVNSIDELKQKILNIFSDDVKGIICTTIHKVKGMEFDNVYIYRPDLMPHPCAESDDEKEQENNMIVVAYTRSKNKLSIINDKIMR